MQQVFIFFLTVLFLTSPKEKKYIIVAGDITCKACVIELHSYLSKKVKKEKLSIALRDKGHFILNESGLSYYKSELPKADFVFLHEPFFPKQEKYPYLLRIQNSDTLKLDYDSLFSTGHLNTAVLK